MYGTQDGHQHEQEHVRHMTMNMKLFGGGCAPKQKKEKVGGSNDAHGPPTEETRPRVRGQTKEQQTRAGHMSVMIRISKQLG